MCTEKSMTSFEVEFRALSIQNRGISFKSALNNMDFKTFLYELFFLLFTFKTASERETVI
jgi:hypothetical protein